MKYFIQYFKSLITKENKQTALLIAFMGTFLYIENYAFYVWEYDYFKSYGIAFMVAIVVRIMVNDWYEWYLGNRN